MTAPETHSSEGKEKPTGATPNPVPEDQIGARIAEKRLAKHLTHDGLAKLTKLYDEPAKSGISRTTIRGYEIGLYKPGTREIRLLCQALEVSPNWLIMGGEDETKSQSASIEAGQGLHQTELQKFLVALHLLRSLDAGEREIVYGVLHGLARLKLGENEYRAGIIVPAEFGALLSDVWKDMKDGQQPDQEKVSALAQAYLPMLEEIARKNLGGSLSNLGGLLPSKTD